MSPAASTPNLIDFASKKRVITRLLGMALIVGMVGTSHPGTSFAETEACQLSGDVFRNYQPAKSINSVPDTQFLAGDGSKVSLQDYRGKGVVLNFWATWCAPCVREMPQLDRLAALVRGNAIEVLTISEDRKGMVLAPKFYEKNKLRDLPVLVDEKSELLRAFNIKGLPSTVLINAEGQEIGRVLGIAEWDSAETVDFVRKCLSPKK